MIDKSDTRVLILVLMEYGLWQTGDEAGYALAIAS